MGAVLLGLRLVRVLSCLALVGAGLSGLWLVRCCVFLASVVRCCVVLGFGGLVLGLNGFGFAARGLERLRC